MTNKEKAYEISEHYATSDYFPTDEEISAYEAAMEMAEYKDNEFKKVLDNTNFQAFTNFREYIQYIKEQLHID